MSARSRGGRFLETAHVHEKERVKRGIGSKFPELGAMQPERDDCAPPLIVCGRCAVCNRAAGRSLASMVLAEHQFEYEGLQPYDPADTHENRVAGLRTSLLALGILAPEDDGDSSGAAQEERTA